MRAFMSWISRALGDGENPSSSRLLAITCVPALLLVPLVVWTVLSIQRGQMLEFPGTVTGFVAAGTTPLLGYLHLNKREETKQEAQKP